MRQLVMASCFVMIAAACSDDDDARSSIDSTTRAVTYWGDMVPLFEAHCLQCHREGGIAPLRLDQYASAKGKAEQIRRHTASRTMPPWGVTSDGSCGEFSDSLALSAEQIAKIDQWVAAGAQEGVARALSVPPLPTLEAGKELKTPLFVPEVEGGKLAESDEYRCFDLGRGDPETSFITGYEVLPGTPEIVHHALLMLVDGEAPAELEDRPGLTNAALMQEFDAASPDRDGWPCFGTAGEGVGVNAIPVTWAPGQGVVRYPNASGVPLLASHHIIVQVHYNLADRAQIGKSDQTTVRLSVAPNVENIGLFLLEDPLLASLYEAPLQTLPPGQASTVFTWRETMKELGLDSLSGVELHGVMPHMHQLGRKYQLRVATGSTPMQCAADVQRWDFHWQRMYFFAKPWKLDADSAFEVSCDFDTSSVSEPVSPGWGTRNEMCLATLYLTVPAAQLMAP